MKEFIASVKKVTEDMAKGRLDCDIIKSLPEDRLDIKDYIFTINFDIVNMNSIDKINTFILCLFILGCFFIYGITGVVVAYSLLALGTLWSTFNMYKRRKLFLDEELPFKNIVDNEEYEISSPYIVAKSEDAKTKFKQVIMYTHYLYDDTLYKTLKNSMSSFTTSMAILVLLTVFLVLYTSSYPIAIAFNVYFASRFLFEVIRLKYTRMMICTIADFHDAANKEE